MSRCTKKRRIRRQCTDKIRYPSVYDARDAIDRAQDYAMHAYECDNCGGYHIGHPPKSLLQRRL